jgi:starvation-inducible outer membrane lipoprotein
MAIHHLCIISLGIAGAVGATAAVAANSKPGLVFSSPTEAVRGVHEGATVLWGGIIFARQDETTQHCVAVVSYPLERKNGRPITTAPSGQVFYACSNAALEWGDYAVGRQLAVAGTLGPNQERVIGHRCATNLLAGPHNFAGSSLTQTTAGCIADIPVVAIADGRTWAGVPRKAGWVNPAYAN